MIRAVIVLLVMLAVTVDCEAKVWHVEQGTAIPDPKTAAGLAADGDTVEITYSAVPYLAYETKWPQKNLLIRGVGTSRPVLKAETYSVTQKAIFVIQGNDVSIENIEFTNARVPDKNGAGIRSEGVNLTVRNCRFYANETGILAGDKPGCKMLIEYCEFDANGFGDGYSHNIYINHIEELTFRHNYTHDCKIGHLLKSRAHNTYVLYNRFDSPLNGNPSREIDLPNGGVAIIAGNIIRQTANGENSNIIGYGLEGLSNPTPHDILLINNTIINEKQNGSFLQIQSGTNMLQLKNNILAGGGSLINISPAVLDSVSNYRVTNIADAGFEDASNQNYHLTSASWAVNHGTVPGSYGNFSLIPVYEYADTADRTDRKFIDKLDIGAFESDFSTHSDDIGISKELSLWNNCIENLSPEAVFVRVFSINGVQLSSFYIDSKEKFCLNGMIPGMYVLTVHTGETLKASYKMILHN